MRIDGPGTLALNCREMHSTGWMPSTRKFCARRSIGVSRNIANGACPLRLESCGLASICPPKPCRMAESTFSAKVRSATKRTLLVAARRDRLRSRQPVPLSARSIPPPGDGDHSLEFHQPTFVHCRHDSLDMPSQFISIIATIKVRYGAAILNDARRLECPKHLSLTSSSAP